MDIDWDLLFRYLGGECSADERERFERWLAADPTHRALLDAAAVAAGRVLAKGISSPLPTGAIGRPAAARRHVSWRFAAAAWLLLAVSGALVWATLGPAGSGAWILASDHVETTARGERATLDLRDGTHVILGAASTLRYPAGFASRSRDVFLTGEAYFVVEHDPGRPFRVHAGGAVAEDLGTAFSVRAYAEDSAVQVVVAEGAVALGAGTANAANREVLTRGQLGRLTKGQGRVTAERVDVDMYLGWTEGRLVFDEDPLSEVLAQLGRWYEASFRIGDTSLASTRVTASFTNEPLTEVLALLAPALGVRFDLRGDTIVVLPRQH